MDAGSRRDTKSDSLLSPLVVFAQLALFVFLLVPSSAIFAYHTLDDERMIVIGNSTATFDCSSYTHRGVTTIVITAWLTLATTRAGAGLIHTFLNKMTWGNVKLVAFPSLPNGKTMATDAVRWEIWLINLVLVPYTILYTVVYFNHLWSKHDVYPPQTAQQHSGMSTDSIINHNYWGDTTGSALTTLLMLLLYFNLSATLLERSATAAEVSAEQLNIADSPLLSNQQRYGSKSTDTIYELLKAQALTLIPDPRKAAAMKTWSHILSVWTTTQAIMIVAMTDAPRLRHMAGLPDVCAGLDVSIHNFADWLPLLTAITWLLQCISVQLYLGYAAGDWHKAEIIKELQNGRIRENANVIPAWTGAWLSYLPPAPYPFRTDTKDTQVTLTTTASAMATMDAETSLSMWTILISLYDVLCGDGMKLGWRYSAANIFYNLLYGWGVAAVFLVTLVVMNEELWHDTSTRDLDQLEKNYRWLFSLVAIHSVLLLALVVHAEYHERLSFHSTIAFVKNAYGSARDKTSAMAGSAREHAEKILGKISKRGSGSA